MKYSKISFVILSCLRVIICFTPTRSLYSKTARSFNKTIHFKRDDPNGHQRDDFGKSVAIQNGIAIVGSPEDDNNAIAIDAGRVFVFAEIPSKGNDWELIREIDDGEPGDYFGWSVALHTDMFAVVGACRDNIFGQYSGGAYYFTVETDPYSEQGELTRIVQSERHGGAFFGFNVAISESSTGVVTVVIGAYGHRSKGAAFVYTRDATGVLGSEQILYASDATLYNKFGWSVSILGDTIAVGAPLNEGQGAVYVYSNSDGVFVQQAKLSQRFADDDDANPLIGDYFGESVAVCDNMIVVSAPNNDVRGSDAGAVFVYQLSEGDSDNARQRRLWNEVLNDYVPNAILNPLFDLYYGKSRRSLEFEDSAVSYVFLQTMFAPNYASQERFGWELSYDAVYGRLAVGSDTSLAESNGFVYVYNIVDNFFALEAIKTHQDNLDDDIGEASDGNFGSSVSIHGDYLCVGANRGYGEVMSSGDVYFFRAMT